MSWNSNEKIIAGEEEEEKRFLFDVEVKVREWEQLLASCCTVCMVKSLRTTQVTIFIWHLLYITCCLMPFVWNNTLKGQNNKFMWIWFTQLYHCILLLFFLFLFFHSVIHIDFVTPLGPILASLLLFSHVSCPFCRSICHSDQWQLPSIRRIGLYGRAALESKRLSQWQSICRREG